ncbi:MAG TPA: Pycsar system effector family protein [Alkalispirochaeta sp.]|nr:Pycsar system effector family protein [Alkalispirochaeta sp.]
MRFSNIPGRFSADYMLRGAQHHHVQLSAMADQKANIIIGFSSVILSVGITQIGGERILWAVPVLIVFAGVALIFAIQAVTPRFRLKEHPDRKAMANPLFFGHFTDLSLDEYEQEMEQILADDAAIYRTVVRDIYQLGQLLKYKKYRYLALSYRVLWVGVVATLAVLITQLALRALGFAV